MFNFKYHEEDLSKISFLVTGGAGFIGSNIVEYLIKYNAKQVIVLDNLTTGSKKNIKPFLNLSNFKFIHGDIKDLNMCKKAMLNVDYVLHQAALGSVPRSIENPLSTNEANITGFLNILIAAKDTNSVKRLVYAASSSTYGDSEELPKQEDKIGKPLSPYAITKYVNELYADVFNKIYGLETIGLRYFNVFGPNQDPNGSYAAVIPKFIKQIINKEDIIINGDGLHSRDFTFVENVVQANILSTFTNNSSAKNQVFNVAYGSSSTLNELVACIIKQVKNLNIDIDSKIVNGPERIGDVKHSLADISKAKKLIKYDPKYSLEQGISLTIKTYL